MTKQVYSVGEVTHFIKHLLESNPNLRGVEVAGEVSNITYHRSGHVYFSIKDSEANLSCVMFRGHAQYAPKMANGDKVVLKGNMSVYAPRGNYQLMVTAAKKQGLGDLYQRFIQLKEKLNQEGLFDPSRKKNIPTIPNRIVVITSATGAAVRDILQTLKRRYNRGEVILIPTVVQGIQGSSSIQKSLREAEKLAPDVIILARGGGSMEDLWNFNEEEVARTLADISLPVVTGVGHETDVTIVDFVADLRTSTPTAAAEAVAPDLNSILHTVNEYEVQLKRSLQYFIDFKRQVLDDYESRLTERVQGTLRQKKHEVELLHTQLEALDIRKALKQGYTLTLKDGIILSDMTSLKEGDEIETIFAKGKTRAKINQIDIEDE
ncbi:MAG: exodeoxyribonuclease VII large subunit [Bacteroidia bacterium]|nr:exodeoxyribonuclease VII large subunit [Bacteroidia bacterium]